MAKTTTQAQKDANAARQRKHRAEVKAGRVLLGSTDFKLTFESGRGTSGCLVRLCAHHGLVYPDAVNELLTNLIHEADEAL